ncbi:MAG: LPS export ABC transporter periplasmic protein LptC [Elusimicrobia bacterium RIFCSPLOWO2_01_FULL_59_12]|nr:MAG: LPS export ABC transporter periplasmic protein LptC [Elusimicrobia bacterium RIFCSPLOWO2_01_FULL_59_12]
MFQVTGAGKFSQVLKDFQMQDIYNGTKNMVVESVEGRVREKDQAVDVDKPRVTFYKQGAVSSVLTAPKGVVAMNTHAVQVWGGVTVVTKGSSTTLTTESLRYDPKKQRFMTQDPVRLERADSVTIGVGLDAEPDLSRVRIGREKVYVKRRST